MEKLCMDWRFKVLKFLFFLLLFSGKCGSNVSAKFLIYRAHAACFCILVAAFDVAVLYRAITQGKKHQKSSKMERKE
jgi:NADH:ubiquinone oxidoreductase subunit 4 (subunit M)